MRIFNDSRLVERIFFKITTGIDCVLYLILAMILSTQV